MSTEDRTSLPEALLVWADPASLFADPANVRTEPPESPELVASIAERGVIEPLVVVPDGEGYRVLAGHRRPCVARALELAAVPCVVRADLADDASRLATAITENTCRVDLTPLEEAHAYAQLSAFGDWNPARIARATGRSEEAVRHGIEVSALPESLQPPAASGQLSLAEAARIEAFADDPAIYASLCEAAGACRIPEVLRKAEQDRGMAEHISEVLGALEAAGVKVIERPGPSDKACRLCWLTDDEGSPLQAVAHAESCPGHAAYLDLYSGDPVELCTDPPAYGHTTPRWYRNEELAAARAAEEEAADGRRAALNEACVPRRDFVRALISAKGRPAPSMLRLVVESLVIDAPDLAAPEDLAWYLGWDAPDPDELEHSDALSRAVRATPDTRMPTMALAVVAASAENNLDRLDHYGFDPAFALRWLAYLQGAGHVLTDAEVALVAELTAAERDPERSSE